MRLHATALGRLLDGVSCSEPGSRRSPDAGGVPEGLRAILRHYATHHRPKAQAELAYFASLPSIETAIERAALARGPDGKRLSHQRRVPQAVLEQGLARLRESTQWLAQALDFMDLLQHVRWALEPVRGIGELTIYDTALRIGAFRRLEPTVVYLHAGTRIGARRMGLDYRQQYLRLSDLPHGLRPLPPHEVEDVLCIYKDRLRPV